MHFCIFKNMGIDSEDKIYEICIKLYVSPVHIWLNLVMDNYEEIFVN